MAVDPYAPIRTLAQLETPRYRAIAEDEWLRDNYGAAMPPAGAVQVADSEGNLSWAMPVQSDVTLDIVNAAAGTPFQSKYSSVVPGPDGSLLATFQRPGMHKHDTFSVLYRKDPTTGQWTMDESTIQNQREKSGARQFWRSVGEGALVVGAGYLGGTALSGMASGGAGAAGGAAGGGSTGGGLAGGGAAGGAGGGAAGGIAGSGLTAPSGFTLAPGLGGGTAGAAGGAAGGIAGGGLAVPAGFTLAPSLGGGVAGAAGGAAGLGGAAAAGGGMWENLLVQAGSMLASSAIMSRAAGKASEAQAAASAQATAEQRRQFDELQKLLAPYVQAGTPALQQLQAIAGTAGPEAQQAAIAQIEQSPFFQSSVRQGEEAMLQRASATGGLRGGNIQGALAQFRPAMLQNAIEQQYARLAGITTLGQQSAAGVGGAGMQTGTNIGNLLTQQGAAQAGGIIGRAAPWAQFANLPGQYAAFQTGRGVNVFGGTQPTMQPNQAPGISPGGYTGFEFGGP